MKLKKIMAAALAGLMVATCAGCSDSGNSGSSSGGESSSGGSSSPTKSEPLKVGVKSDVIGFGLKDTVTNEYTGLEIELAKKIASELGYNGVEFTTVTAATRTELLDSGDLDCVLATFTITEERKKSWDFSTPYFTDAVTVLVEKADNITDLSGLVGKKIGVSTGSNSAYNLAKAMSEKGLFGDYKVPESSKDFDISSFEQNGTKFEQFGDYPAISNAMAAGTVDAFCVDKSILAAYKTNERDYITDTFAPQDYGVATKKDSELSKKIDELIVKWKADGTIDKLIKEFNLD